MVATMPGKVMLGAMVASIHFTTQSQSAAMFNGPNRATLIRIQRGIAPQIIRKKLAQDLADGPSHGLAWQTLGQGLDQTQ